MRNEATIRESLVAVLRALALQGVKYREGSVVPATGEAPRHLDCSTAVAYACGEVLHDPAWLNIWSIGAWAPSAWQMWSDLRGWDTGNAQGGDLAFYSRRSPGKPPDPRWHVMMVTENGGVVG